MNTLNDKKLWVLNYTRVASDAITAHINWSSYIPGLLLALSEKFCYGEEVHDIAFSSGTVFINCKNEGKAWHSVSMDDYMEFIASYGE